MPDYAIGDEVLVTRAGSRNGMVGRVIDAAHQGNFRVRLTDLEARWLWPHELILVKHERENAATDE